MNTTMQAWNVRYYFPRGETPAVDWNCVVSAISEETAMEAARLHWKFTRRVCKAFMTAVPVDADEMPYLAETVARREEWQKLLDVPSYVEKQAAQFARCDISQVVEEEDVKPLVVWMEDEPKHSFTQPFCDDALCPCHTDEALFDECIEQPVQSGLLKMWDAQALLWPER